MDADSGQNRANVDDKMQAEGATEQLDDEEDQNVSEAAEPKKKRKDKIGFRDRKVCR